MLGRRAAGARLEEAAARHQRDDGEHLGARAELKDGKEVGEVVAKDVARDRDGVVTLADPLEAQLGRSGRSEDGELQTGRVILAQVGRDLLDELGIVRTGRIEPEDRRRAGGAGPRHSELHPVTDRGILHLAGAPDVARLHRMLHEHRTGCIDDANRTGSSDLEGLVVRAILLRLLRHQAHVGHAAHRAGVERAVGAAEVDDLLVDAGVGAVGNHSLGILRLASSIPHLARLAEHRRHGGVDDHIARHMEVGDALVGVHHRDRRPVCQRCSDVGLDGCALLSRELRQFLDHVAEAVVHIDA